MVRDYSKPDNLTDITKSVHSYKPQVNGGTAYAVQRALQRGIPVYFFDQKSGEWLDLIQFKGIGTPRLTQHAAVIGTREINDAGKQAIKDVFNNLLAKSVEESLPKETKATISEGLTQKHLPWNNGDVYNADQILNEYKNSFVDLHQPFFKLADAVFARAKQLGITFKCNENLSSTGVYHADTKVVEFRKPSDQRHNTLLHEAIHAVVGYQITMADVNPELLSKEELAAIEELKFVYERMKESLLSENAMKRSLELLEEKNYGLTSFSEFTAELSSSLFRERIKEFDKKHGNDIFKKLIEAIFKLLGINKTYTNAETTAYQALKTLLENTNNDIFDRANKYYKFRRELENLDHSEYVTLYIPDDMKDMFEAAVADNSKHRTLKFKQSEKETAFSPNEFARMEPGRIMWIQVGGNRALGVIESVPEKLDNDMYSIQYSVIDTSEFENMKIENSHLLDAEQPRFADEHGNYYGWSVESIYNHLHSYVIESTGISDKEKLSHVKKVNELYGTNFRAFKKNGIWQLLNNTNGYDKLKLSENPNEPKQLELFDSQENQVTELDKLGKNLRENQCK